MEGHKGRSGQARLGHYDAKFVSDSCPSVNVEIGQGDALVQRRRTERQPGINGLSVDASWRAVFSRGSAETKFDFGRELSLPDRNNHWLTLFRNQEIDSLHMLRSARVLDDVDSFVRIRPERPRPHYVRRTAF